MMSDEAPRSEAAAAPDDEPRTRADWAYAVLERAILRGELSPGERLNEPSLARKFGVSRGPLREAIRGLEGRKLVRRVAHIGTTVVKLSPEDLREIFQLREVLEGLACRLATENMSDTELDILQSMLRQAEAEMLGETGPGSHLNGGGDPDFHLVIIRGSQSARVIDALAGELYPLMRLYRFRSQRSPGRLKQALAEHAAILNAMRARDAEKAETAMRLHIRSGRINLLNEERRAAPARLSTL